VMALITEFPLVQQYQQLPTTLPSEAPSSSVDSVT
jgi:hypothetical protein